MKQIDLANALGISAPMVSKLKRMGMPVTDIESARRWRDANLDPALVKDSRSMVQPDVVNGPDRVGLVNKLGVLALADFPAHGEALRTAFLALTAEEQDRVRLDAGVFDLLTAPPSAENAAPGAPPILVTH